MKTHSLIHFDVLKRKTINLAEKCHSRDEKKWGYQYSSDCEPAKNKTKNVKVVKHGNSLSGVMVEAWSTQLAPLEQLSQRKVSLGKLPRQQECRYKPMFLALVATQNDWRTRIECIIIDVLPPTHKKRTCTAVISSPFSFLPNLNGNLERKLSSSSLFAAIAAAFRAAC